MKPQLLCSLLLAVISYGQTSGQPLIKNQQTIGGSSGDLCYAIYLTTDGGIMLAGSSASDSSGEKTSFNRGAPGTDYWIIKLDNNGVIQWDKTIGGSNQDGLAVVQQTSDGGYILGGSSNSDRSFEKSQNNRDTALHYYNDYWVVKLDNAGNIQWDKTIGGTEDDVLTAVQQTSDGGYILGGYSYSGISGEKTGFNRGLNPGIEADYWIVKLSASGNIQWDKTIGGAGDDKLTAMQQTTDNGYILGGLSISDVSYEKTSNSYHGTGGGFPPTSYPTYDYWILKLSASGSIQWDKTIGGTDRDELYALQQTTDKGYILGGKSASNISGDKTENHRGLPTFTNEDYWVVKLDSSATIQWDKTIGGSMNDGLTSLQQTSDDGYILGGNSQSNISDDKTEDDRCGCSFVSSNRKGDYWMVKLNGDGGIQWDKTIGGNKPDNLTSVRELAPNRYIAGGYSVSGKTGDKTQFKRGDLDFWVIELKYKRPDNIVSAPVFNTNSLRETGKNKDILVYPNPAKDILHIQNSGKAGIALINQSGKTVLEKIVNGNEKLNIGHLPAGLYFLKHTETGKVQKIIITK